MSVSRRQFLGITSSLLATSASAPFLLRQTARAATLTERQNDNILVVVQLTGGNDGLNTVVPFADETYRRLRPTLHLADAQLHKLDHRIGLHPELGDLKKLFDDGQAAVVQSVGYPHPNKSHFESMAIWHTAPTDAQLAHGRGQLASGGWLARAIDRGMNVEEQTTAIPALRVGEGPIPDALIGSRAQVPSIRDVAQLQACAGLLGSTERDQQALAWEAIAGDATNPLLQAAAESLVSVHATAQQIEALSALPEPRVKYPRYDFAGQLRTIGRLIHGGFSPSIYYTELDGFDTHSDQLGTHENLLGRLGEALSVFMADVKEVAPHRPVLVMVFSEFGRRVAENASRGTDHGTAAPLFLIGDQVNPGIHGPHPDLDNLVEDDPVFAIDFRRVYATVIERWLGLPSQEILGAPFEVMDLLAQR
jgi:uncharacterized protein (DUF1501 family)